VDGIYCSNHGGRQANGGLAALDALPEVVEAADGLPVLFDSGIRSGADVVKALALGATAVGVGRPYVYGLALEGTNGIVHVLRALLGEADLIMAVDGYPTLKDLRVDGAIRRIASTPGRPPLEPQVRLITRLPRSRESPRSGDDISPASRQALDGPAPRRFRREGGSDMTSPGEGGQLTFARDIRRPFRTKDRASMRSAFDLSATRMLPSMPTPSLAPALITGERGRRGPGRYR